MKQRTKKVMEGRECFLKDLTEGATFRMRHTGGTVYTFYQKGENNYIVTTDSGSFFASPNTPVKPLIKF
jgi:hypothetical protein